MEQIPPRRGSRRKIQIEYVPEIGNSQLKFCKKKAHLMKRTHELTILTWAQVLLLVASSTGHVYTFATPNFEPIITLPEGKSLITSCLQAPEELIQSKPTEDETDSVCKDFHVQCTLQQNHQDPS